MARPGLKQEEKTIIDNAERLGISQAETAKFLDRAPSTISTHINKTKQKKPIKPFTID